MFTGRFYAQCEKRSVVHHRRKINMAATSETLFRFFFKENIGEEDPRITVILLIRWPFFTSNGSVPVPLSQKQYSIETVVHF